MNASFTLRAALPMLLALACVEAIAEPGTPAWVTAEQLRATGTIAKLPMAEVKFRGYREKVRFHVAWKIDGRESPLDVSKSWGGCPGFDATVPYDKVQFVCVSPGGYYDKPGHSNNGTYVMYFRNLDWNREYCFRVRTQDDDGVFSKLWTGWACMRTNASPPAPEPATDIGLTLLPGSSGRGEVGPGRPSKLLVEWSPGRNAVDQWVERAPLAPNARFERAAIGAVLTGADHEAAFPYAYLEEKDAIQVRVCTQNVAGAACSIARRFPPRSLKDNARAGDVPRHGAPPITRPFEAQKSPGVTPAPPPVTSTNATSPKPATPALTPNGMTRQGSSFGRDGGGLR